MEKYKLRSFLRENPTKENISFVFPSTEDVAVDPDLFMAAVVSRGDNFDPLTLEFMQRFLRDLHAGQIGMMCIYYYELFTHLHTTTNSLYRLQMSIVQVLRKASCRSFFSLFYVYVISLCNIAYDENTVLYINICCFICEIR